MRCRECGSRQFEEFDGFQTCVECGWQSEFLTMEANVDEVIASQGIRTVRRRDVPIEREPVEEMPLADNRIIFYETIQYALIAQAKVLVDEKGVSDRLESTVMKIWFRWLELSGLCNGDSGEENTSVNNTVEDEEMIASTGELHGLAGPTQRTQSRIESHTDTRASSRSGRLSDFSSDSDSDSESCDSISSTDNASDSSTSWPWSDETVENRSDKMPLQPRTRHNANYRQMDISSEKSSPRLSDVDLSGEDDDEELKRSHLPYKTDIVTGADGVADSIREHNMYLDKDLDQSVERKRRQHKKRQTGPKLSSVEAKCKTGPRIRRKWTNYKHGEDFMENVPFVKARMEMTLSILHLACLWERASLFLNDLTKLVRDGRLPYFAAYRLHPRYKEVVVYKYHRRLRPGYMPGCEKVYARSVRVLNNLKLSRPGFPGLNAKSLFERMVTELNLPPDLAKKAYTLHQMSKIPLTISPLVHIGYKNQVRVRHWGSHRNPPRGILAAFICISLKLMYGISEFDEFVKSDATCRPTSRSDFPEQDLANCTPLGRESVTALELAANSSGNQLANSLSDAMFPARTTETTSTCLSRTTTTAYNDVETAADSSNRICSPARSGTAVTNGGDVSSSGLSTTLMRTMVATQNADTETTLLRREQWSWKGWVDKMSVIQDEKAATIPQTKNELTSLRVQHDYLRYLGSEMFPDSFTTSMDIMSSMFQDLADDEIHSRHVQQTEVYPDVRDPTTTTLIPETTAQSHIVVHSKFTSGVECAIDKNELSICSKDLPSIISELPEERLIKKHRKSNKKTIDAPLEIEAVPPYIPKPRYFLFNESEDKKRNIFLSALPDEEKVRIKNLIKDDVQSRAIRLRSQSMMDYEDVVQEYAEAERSYTEKIITEILPCRRYVRYHKNRFLPEHSSLSYLISVFASYIDFSPRLLRALMFRVEDELFDAGNYSTPMHLPVLGDPPVEKLSKDIPLYRPLVIGPTRPKITRPGVRKRKKLKSVDDNADVPTLKYDTDTIVASIVG
eukprot:CFRG5508T1